MHHTDKPSSTIHIFISFLPDMSEALQVVHRRRRKRRAQLQGVFVAGVLETDKMAGEELCLAEGPAWSEAWV